ncbi:hypothetical protein CANTEDRAFT_103610 [Yamadazyma tenuis ATCC 10573]|uniref:Enoyl reductase (ER) domain-containing protein n=2 Tax=Candida tenuis TaxID=2315449 RepID=G3B150_CANTC|nr:uncharacterized protein CANTEDRAFT_103610 [Yamadazyma tenuis ATCC 10573]EGV64879.1 hypothetical protein CANTEDRAFT_103610 [Yamadazyma tenuis ATCC 10573]
MYSFPKSQKAIVLTGTSDTYEVLKYQDVPTPQIESPKGIIIKGKYAAVNFVETYFRKGWNSPQIPLILGRDGAGEIAAVGSEVKDFKVGDKVVYLLKNSYSEYIKTSAEEQRISKLPADTTEKDLELYGSLPAQAITAYIFAEKAGYTPKTGDHVLVWTAAGGVGQVLVQLLNDFGVNVIGLSSTDEKLEFVKSLGAKYTINYKTDDVVSKVKEFTEGKGVNAVYDAVGKASFDTTIASLGQNGVFISYGTSSGAIPPVNLGILTPKNLVFTKPNLFGFLPDRNTWNYYLNKVIYDYKSGRVKYSPVVYDMKDYAKVTELLEAGSTSSKFVLKI